MPSADGAPPRHRPGRSALVVGVLVLLVAGLGLSARRHPLHDVVSDRVAVRAALDFPPLHRALAGSGWERTVVSPVDPRLVRVQFFAGAREVGEAAVGPGGRVVQGIAVRRMAVPYGDWLAYEPALLAGLSALFVLMVGVTPLWRPRNLDALAMLSLVLPILLLQRHEPDASVLTSLPGLLYLFGRCLWRALGPAAASAPGLPADGRAAPVERPLWEYATSALDPRVRLRLLRLTIAGLTVMFVAIGVSSPAPVDVLFAVMEGATRLLHGVLPYGHMPGDVIHGDTYPLLTYLAYLPLAGLAPVTSTWNSVDVGLAAGVLIAVLAAAGIAAAVSRRGDVRDREAGLRAVLVWLSFPPVLVTVSTGTTDIALAGLLLAAVVAWRRPAWATGLLSAAAWFKLAPALLLPFVLAPLRGRERRRAWAMIAAVSAPPVALVLGLGGVHGATAMVQAIAYQFTRGSNQSLWAVLDIGAAQPFGEAAVLALVAGVTWRLRRDRELAHDSSRIAALAAAVLIGLQLSAEYWAFLYVVWFVPLIAVSLLAPGHAEAATGTAATVPARLPAATQPA